MKPIKDALKNIQLPNESSNGQPPERNAAEIAAAVRTIIEAQKEDHNPFPLDAFPESISRIVRHWNRVYRRPVDFHGGSILAAASAAIGNAFHVEYQIGSVQPLAVWSVIVGPPSSAKSPIMRICMRPLFDREKTYRDQHKAAVADWKKECIKKAKVKSKEPEKPRPTREQRIVSDVTIEALIKVLMQENCWRGVIAFKDEFIGLMKGMNAYKSSGQDLEHYLSMWSGMPIILNRSSLDEAGFIESPFVSMLGAIQPGILTGLTDGGKIANGFLYRLLFSYPENVQIPKPSGEIPRQEVYDEYARIIHRLNDLPAREDHDPIHLRLNAEAYKLYTEYKTGIEQGIINQTEDENIQSLYGKIIDYTLRIAAILDLLDLVSTADQGFLNVLSAADMEKHRISTDSIRRAIQFSEYFTRNSIKILEKTEDPVAMLPHKQQIIYDKLPNICRSKLAIEVAEKLGMGEKTARRLIRNPKLFKQTPDGLYRKLFT